jgi:phosphoglycolate phosphatase-like HAD superfamily hydrolase
MSALAEAVDLIVFDFDGTICESANVKTDAFYELYLDEQGPDFAAAVRRYHLEFAGVSRYEKIRYIEETMLERRCTSERMDEIADLFGDLVRGQVVASPLVPGVADFFAAHKGQVPMLVASATPTDELRSIIAARDIQEWFDEVEGSPALKGDIIASFLARRRVSRDRAMMVGDQFSDLDAAQASGVLFVRYRSVDEERLFDESVRVVNNFADLPAAIVATAAATTVSGSQSG